MTTLMKVALINQYYGLGSTGKIVSDLQDYMDSIRINSHAFCAMGEVTSRASLYGDVFHLRASQLENRLLGNHGFGFFTTTTKLLSDLDKYKPDIVHLHNIHGFYLNVELLFAYLVKHNIPVVWTFHDCWPITGHCAYFDYIGCDKWKIACYDCECLSRYPQSWVDRSKKYFEKKKKMLTSCKNLNIVTPSNWLKEIVNDSFLSTAQSVNVINNGIDLEVFKPQNHDLIKQKMGYKGKTVILGVSSGGFSERKGGKYFAELVDKLDSRYKIILIGVNDDDLSYLPYSIKTIKRTNNQAELAEYYSMADIFLNPTLEDNFPTVNIEALACGTPVITFPTGGSVESVFEGVGAVTQNCTSDALKVVIENTAITDSVRFKCRSIAVKRFSKLSFSQKYCELYRKIL